MGVVLPGRAAASQDEEDQVGEQDLSAREQQGHDGGGLRTEGARCGETVIRPPHQ